MPSESGFYFHLDEHRRTHRIGWYPSPGTGSVTPYEGLLSDASLSFNDFTVRSAYATLNRVKACKHRCSAALEQCVLLLIALRDRLVGDPKSREDVTTSVLKNFYVLRIYAEISIMDKVDKKISDWAALSPLQSFLRRDDIRREIDKILQNVAALILKFKVLDVAERHPASHILLEEDNREIRDLLQIVVGSPAEMQSLLSMSDQPLYQVMETLQTELNDPHLAEPIRSNFVQALRLLHAKTNELPLTDATIKSKFFHRRESGSSSEKKPLLSLRRPRTAEGSSSKFSSGHSHLRVPSMPSSSSATPPADSHPPLTMGGFVHRLPGAVDYSEGIDTRSPPPHGPASHTKFANLYHSDRSTPSLFPDTDSDLQSARSGSSQYSLPESLMLLDITPAGDVFAGNLEGLVDRLLTPDTLKHSEFQEVVLCTCCDFTTPENLLAMIIRRFYEAELNPTSSETLQSNTFGVLTFWLSSHCLQVHPHLLTEIEQFCLSVISAKGSPMNENARRLLRLTKERASRDNPPPSPTPSSTKIPRTADILPRDLAIALTLLEGEKYRLILPADYIRHLRKMEGPNKVDAAGVENNRVILWVKKSVLTPSRVETRAEVLKFFVNAAHECRKLRNFASLSAITNALQSTPIERLTLTVGALSPHLRDMLQDLKNLLDPSNNHVTYRAALKPEEALDPQYKDFCIPWLAVHLRDLHSLLENYPLKVQIDGRPLINFRRYTKFMEHVRGLSLFKPPDLERYRQNGQLAYLQHQLRGIHFDPDSDVALMQRSLELEADETRIHRTRALELKRLGFRS